MTKTDWKTAFRPEKKAKPKEPVKPSSGEYRAYTLGLFMGGLMEDPDWHVEHVRTVWATSLREAKQRWAIVTEHNDKYWDEEQQTYWGWRVIEV